MLHNLQDYNKADVYKTQNYASLFDLFQPSCIHNRKEYYK